MCEKCGRKFARGDALARHARGEGGCAGRRSSMGGLLEGDEMMGSGDGGEGDDVLKRIMDNPMGSSDDGDILMTDQDPDTPSVDNAPNSATPDTRMSTPTTSNLSSARRPASLPSIKTNVADRPNNSHLHPHNNHHHAPGFGGSYPPMTPIRSAASATSQHPGSGLFPPATPGAKNPTGRRGTTPMGMSGITPSITSGTITESPGPLSPNSNPLDRAKSPYHLAPKPPQQQQQPHHYQMPMTPQSAQGSAPALPTQFGRQAPQANMAGNNATAANSSSTSSNNTFSYQQNPQQPPRFDQGEQRALPPNNPNGNSNNDGGADNPNVFENEQGIWTYTKELERRVAELEEKVQGFDAVLQGLVKAGQISQQQVRDAQREVAAQAAAGQVGETGQTQAAAGQTASS